jgi:2-dehydro-3-deoxygalactonokinase
MPAEMFVSGDWGTSRLRLRLFQADPLVLRAEAEAATGIAHVYAEWLAAASPDDREGFFLERLAPVFVRLEAVSGQPLRDVPLVLSGMASASIGLRELPYASTPFPLQGGPLVVARLEPGALPVPTVLVSGVCTDDDVMRGEETILIGLNELRYGDGFYLLPGTHSKHIEVRAGIVKGFRTYLTGELFALLREHSVLRPCLTAGSNIDEAFVSGVLDAGQTNLLHELFALRARSLLRGVTPEANGQRLSGLLIGSELHQLNPNEGPIWLAASEPLLTHYAEALRQLGFGPWLRVIPTSVLTLAVAWGQREILKRL